MTADGFLICPRHGDIFWTENVYPDMVISAHTVEPLHELAPTPVNGHERLCFCGLTLLVELRPKVRVLSARGA